MSLQTVEVALLNKKRKKERQKEGKRKRKRKRKRKEKKVETSALPDPPRLVCRSCFPRSKSKLSLRADGRYVSETRISPSSGECESCNTGGKMHLVFFV